MSKLAAAVTCVGAIVATVLPSPAYADPAPPAGRFAAFRTPVAGYVDGSCVADFSGVQDGSLLGSAEGCGWNVNFSQSLRKHTVPDGGWLSWGSPPDTESSTPSVAASLPGATTVTLNYSHPQEIGGVEIEPAQFKRCSFTVDFYRRYGGDGTLEGSVTRTADGRAGAKLFAGRVGRGFVSLVITSNDGCGFAIAQIRG